METGQYADPISGDAEYPYEDRLAEAAHYFTTQNDQNVVIKTTVQPYRGSDYLYHSKTFQQMEDAIRTGRLEDFPIGSDQFARKYLIEEIGKNLDAMYSSQYFYRTLQIRTGRKMLYAGFYDNMTKDWATLRLIRTRPMDFQEMRGILPLPREDAPPAV